jgi:hypothetical protein
MPDQCRRYDRQHCQRAAAHYLRICLLAHHLNRTGVRPDPRCRPTTGSHCCCCCPCKWCTNPHSRTLQRSRIHRASLDNSAPCCRAPRDVFPLSEIKEMVHRYKQCYAARGLVSALNGPGRETELEVVLHKVDVHQEGAGPHVPLLLL